MFFSVRAALLAARGDADRERARLRDELEDALSALSLSSVSLLSDFFCDRRVDRVIANK